MVDSAPILNSHSILQYCWVSIAAGLVVFIVIKSASRWGMPSCLIGGFTVVAIVDLVDILAIVQIYRPKANLPADWNFAMTIAKLCGGALYGFCFWFIKPFHEFRKRPLAQSRNYDPYGDF